MAALPQKPSRRRLDGLLLIGVAVAALALLAPLSASAATLKLGPSNQGLVGYWSMNEGTGTLAHDFL